MQIVSHRGLWRKTAEHNTIAAFERSFELGMGVETDLRDRNGGVVVAHDPPKKSTLPFAELLRAMDGRNLPLALNIKADGLAKQIKRALAQFNHDNYFVFDMSLPDMRWHLQCDMPVFAGMSDLQPRPPLLAQCAGVWLDSFESDWFGARLIDKLLAQNKKICVVSPELHRRPFEKQWKTIRMAKSVAADGLMLCTDHPLQARDFFNAISS